MTTVLLVRHALTAQTGAVLSGWTPGLHLDERGRRQAAALAERLRGITLAAIVTSPLERCLETAAALADGRALEPQPDERLGESRYGEWTGRTLKELARDPLWKTVLAHPSGAAFPGGEPLRAMAVRAVAAIGDWNERLGRDAVYLVCSHADPIRAIVADALGLHLDGIGRIAVDPASLTVIRYGPLRPVLLRLNERSTEPSGGTV